MVLAKEMLRFISTNVRFLPHLSHKLELPINENNTKGKITIKFFAVPSSSTPHDKNQGRQKEHKAIGETEVDLEILHEGDVTERRFKGRFNCPKVTQRHCLYYSHL